MTTRRRFILGTAAALAAPAIIARRGYAVEMTSVKIGSILGGTTAAGELLPKYLKEVGVTAEVVNFPNITQRMQAVASGDVQIGYGGINAAILMLQRGFKLSLLANGCDGGSYCLGKPAFKTLNDLKGKKLAVTAGTISHAAAQAKLHSLGLTKDVELVFMNYADMPVPMQRGDIDAMIAFEPYPTYVRLNGWATDLWEPYDTPMGRTNLGFVAAQDFIKKYPVLAREIVKAHKKATDELIKDPTLAVDTIAKVLNLPRNVAEASIKNTFFAWKADDAFKTSVMAMGQMMVDSKMMDKLPDWTGFFDFSLVDA
ncbi:MAG: ABC transporter substrate-binding protein [Alphaproteobacteria bacterium]|nr:ABC transporter substrate-binding protein [Alphaproteobacteria bacterium]